MNTATYRGIALKAEKELLWAKAAANWERAIAKYPNPVGALAKAGIERMAARAKSCRATANEP